MMAVVFTIGHSLHGRDDFLALLGAHNVDLLVDVRSIPFSRRASHFARRAREEWLPAAGIAYRFHGNALGSKSRGGWIARAASPDFRAAIEELVTLAPRTRPAIMSAQKDPMNCHRAYLVAPALAAAGAEVRHLLADGSLLSHRAFEERLLAMAGLEAGDLFLTERKERLAQARRWLFAGRR